MFAMKNDRDFNIAVQMNVSFLGVLALGAKDRNSGFHKKEEVES